MTVPLHAPPPEQPPLVVGLELGVAALLALLGRERVAAADLGPDKALVLRKIHINSGVYTVVNIHERWVGGGGM